MALLHAEGVGNMLDNVDLGLGIPGLHLLGHILRHEDVSVVSAIVIAPSQ